MKRPHMGADRIENTGAGLEWGSWFRRVCRPRQNLRIYNFEKWKTLENKAKGFPFFELNEFAGSNEKSFLLNFVSLSIEDLFKPEFDSIINNEKVVFVISTDNKHGMAEQRRIFFELVKREIKNPVIIKRDYNSLDSNLLMLYSATDFGSLFIDGFGDGAWITIQNFTEDLNKFEMINRTLFGNMQAARVRISKTEYIACPSCGRTLFDLVEVTAKIRKRTGHLKGVKIGIMGCIVNGPGEMADADYGYVGSGIGKITLYKGKEVVKRSVPSESAVDELIEIIKEDGAWIEEPENN